MSQSKFAQHRPLLGLVSLHPTQDVVEHADRRAT